jgi:hypothetical protein
LGTKPASTAARRRPSRRRACRPGFEHGAVVVAAAQATAAGDDDLGGAQLGAGRLGELAADQLALAQVGAGGDGFDRGVPPRRRVEGGGAHGDDLDRVGRLDGGQRVAGVDRAHEGVGGFDGDDVGDLGHVEQRGDAGQHVLAEGGGGGQHVAVAAGLDEADQQRGEVLGALLGVGGGVGHLHLGHAGQLGGGLGGGGAAAPATSTSMSAPSLAAARRC